jgi:hypothetical protein
MGALYTYEDLRLMVLRNLDEAGDTGTTRDLVNDFINQAQQEICAAQGWPFMEWAEPQTLTLVASQRLYALHSEFARAKYFWNITKGCYLQEMPERNVVSQGVRWRTDQNTQLFRFTGVSPVLAQPTSSSVITLVSSSASDTGVGKAITVTGMTATGVASESFTPVGLTPVVGTTAFTKVLGVTKALAWAGTLTLTAGAVNILTLLPAEFGRQHQQIELLFQPAGGDSIEYQFYRQPTSLSADHDIPDIPAPHSLILVWGALQMMGSYLTEASGQAVNLWSMRYNKALESLQSAFLDGQTRGAMAKYGNSFADSAWALGD